ncbi:ATP-binding protein [Mycolicibacterium boenickei]
MAALGGGVRAASGLFYQYLFTIETLLDLIEQKWPESTVVTIEGPDHQGSTDPDVVDFAVHHPRDGIVAVYQAKSVANPSDSTLSLSEALPPLVRLIRSVDSAKYVLISNAKPGRHIDRINSLLHGEYSDAEVVAELLALAGEGSKAAQVLRTLDHAGGIAPLRRAQIIATGEPAALIRSRIADKVARWRSDHRLALGERASRILENSLIAGVFSRASSADVGTTRDLAQGPRQLSLATFAEFLAEPETALAQAAALVEAGEGIQHAPNGHGVDRPELFSAIVNRFNNIRTRRAQLSVLVGPSGIGKTRLAAMYAHREHRSYDRVCWIDAESDAAIIASIVNQARIIGISDIHNGGPTELANEFRNAVHRFIGRWLIVFDDAQSARQIEHWITEAANADIVVTSTNAVDWTAYDPITVTRMAEDQALELLASRLQDDVGHTRIGHRRDADAALARLADRLEYRPLALQIAAAHFQTTSALVGNLDTYLASIDDFVANLVADPTLDRDGYPRTLQATINICIDRLVTAAAHDAIGATALKMLLASSVLASHRIPAVLVYAMATDIIDATGKAQGPREELRAQMPTISAAIRRIRTQSLIEPGQHPDSGVAWELRQRLDVNEIVQHVVRGRCILDEAFNAAAAHVISWLAHYIDGQDFTGAVALQPHAWALLSRAESAGGAVVLRALLAGNQAALLDLQGKSKDALAWLHWEWAILHQLDEPLDRVKALTADQIVKAMIHDGCSLEEALPFLQQAVSSLQSWAADHDPNDHAGALMCLNLHSAIATLEMRQSGPDRFTAELEELRKQVLDAQTRFPDEEAARLLAQTLSAEQHLDHGRYDEALANTKVLLNAIGAQDHIQRIHARTLQFQALVGQLLIDDGQIGAVRSALEHIAKECEDHPKIVIGKTSGLLNVSVQLEAKRLLTDSPQEPLKEVFRTIVRLTSKLCTNDYERYCHVVLAACEATHNNDIVGATTLLDLAQARMPAHFPGTVGARSNVAMMVPWLRYWVECTQTGVVPRINCCELYYFSKADDALGLYVGDSALSADLRRQYQTSRDFFAAWEYDVLGCQRAIVLRTTHSGKPAAFILLADEPVAAAAGGYVGDSVDDLSAPRYLWLISDPRAAMSDKNLLVEFDPSLGTSR